MKDFYKLIRYNTGTDKKLFAEFSNEFDAVLMNATIVAYSGSAMADLITVYKDMYIIDPQTYILQQNYELLKSSASKDGGIKKSIVKYLEILPSIFLKTLNDRSSISTQMIEDNLDELVKQVGEFELNYISSFIKTKEYNKYLEFIDENEDGAVGKPQPKMIIAPYFMLKDSYNTNENKVWLDINRQSIVKFIQKFKPTNYPIAGQLVMGKDVLENISTSGLLEYIIKTYADIDFEYFYVWVDDFSPIESDIKISKAFATLIKELNNIGKKPIMAYGGYDSILLCHKDAPTKMYGVAQSVGYGEKRQITPVGGGLPVNKYYFLPTHQRLKTEDISSILSAKGYFDRRKTARERAEEFYKNICNCKQCQKIIGKNFDKFSLYFNAKPFTMKNGISRNRPTQEALDISARHFLFCKVKEWDSIVNETFENLIQTYKSNIDEYGRYYERSLYSHVLSWITNYAE